MRNYYGSKSSNVLDYQPILETAFIEFLTSDGASEKTRANYCSDLRHFIGWTQLTIASKGFTHPVTHIEFVQQLTPELLSDYKSYLSANHIPAATINRRLSTLRMFVKVALQMGWITQNPMHALTNIAPKPQSQSFDAILTHWKHDLEQSGASKSTIKNYLTDVRKFLEWTSATT